MTSFTDRLGNEWKLSIDLSMLPALRAVGFNLSEVAKNPKAFDDLDLEATGRVLWVMVEEQAAARGLTPEKFTKGFDGPTLFDATAAIWGAVVDFSQRPAVATALKQKLPAWMEQVDRKAVAQIQALDPIRDRSGSTGSAGASPALSDSIPAG